MHCSAYKSIQDKMNKQDKHIHMKERKKERKKERRKKG
jgi:hypothetical protein